LQGKVEGVRKFNSSATDRFIHEFSRVPVHSRAPVQIPTTLTASIPRKIPEPEAERLPDGVDSMPSSADGGSSATSRAVQRRRQSVRRRQCVEDPALTLQPDSNAVVRRDLIDEARRLAEEAAKARLRELANQPSPGGGWAGDPACGPNFCQPFPSVPGAVRDLLWAGPLILAGIATKVNPRVVPLWASYMSGGAGVANLSSRFGSDFTNSPTTQETTRFLVEELRRLVETDHVTLMGGASRVTVDVSSNLISARRAINTSGGADEMNFDVPTDIAGNIAGGIGADQSAHPFGNQPSPVNDSRAALISATLVRNANGTITVTPSIRYRVTDTIDLCPGNCGTTDEQVATVPLSRFEATGLVGDVPFNIDFDAPASELGAFTVTPSAPPAPPPSPAVHGTVTASALRYRAAPDTSSAVLGRYPRGTDLELECRTRGTTVLGNDTWYRTSDGYVSGRYVSLVGPGTPPTC